MYCIIPYKTYIFGKNRQNKKIMKAIILTFSLLAACSTVCLAQCDKHIILTSSKTQHLDGSGSLQQTADEKTTIDINKSDITVLTSGDNGDQKMTGKVKSDSCNWTVPFKEGKSKLNITLSRDDGESRDFTVTIEGKDGKVTLLAESPDMPDQKIKLDIETFEEKD